MSDETIRLQLQERTIFGKAVKNLRQDGFIPAIIQESGKPTIAVMAAAGELDKVYDRAGQRHPVELDFGKAHQLAVIKEVELDPVKRRILHVVFQAVKANEKITAEVPLEFTEGEIPAEKAGLMVLKTLDQVEVEALPSDMPDSLSVDPTGLAEVGDKLSVADIKVPANVTILTEPENSVAIVEEPRVVEEESAETEEGAEEEVPAEHGDKSDENVGEESDKPQ